MSIREGKRTIQDIINELMRYETGGIREWTQNGSRVLRATKAGLQKMPAIEQIGRTSPSKSEVGGRTEEEIMMERRGSAKSGNSGP